MILIFTLMVRCGMVYLEPEGLGLDPLVNCWLRRLPKVSGLRISKIRTTDRNLRAL